MHINAESIFGQACQLHARVPNMQGYSCVVVESSRQLFLYNWPTPMCHQRTSLNVQQRPEPFTPPQAQPRVSAPLLQQVLPSPMPRPGMKIADDPPPSLHE